MGCVSAIKRLMNTQPAATWTTKHTYKFMSLPCSQAKQKSSQVQTYWLTKLSNGVTYWLRTSSTELLLWEEFNNRMFFIVRQTEACATLFMSLQHIMPSFFSTYFTKNVLLQSSPLPQDVTKQTIAVNTGRVLQSYVNHTYLLFEKEPPLVYSNPASWLQCKRRCTWCFQ